MPQQPPAVAAVASCCRRWSLRRAFFRSACLTIIVVLTLQLLTDPPDEAPTAVLIMAANRPEVQLLIRQIFAYRPSAAQFPVIVSQDSDDAMTSAALQPLADGGGIDWRRQAADRGEKAGPMTTLKRVERITRHYRRALDYVLMERRFHRVIVLEDDLLIAADFFRYFQSLAPVLDSDSSVFCISAWHDNAMLGLVDAGPRGAAAVHRTDFFPGLGWMIRREAWPAVRATWPNQGEFDCYLRYRMLLSGQVCLRPEVPRVFNTGQSGGTRRAEWYGRTFHRRFLSRMAFNLLPDARIPPAVVRRLAGGPSSDTAFAKRVARLPTISRRRLLTLAASLTDNPDEKLPSEVQFVYRSAKEYNDLALRLGIIPDFWYGVPRCSRRGIVGLRLLHHQRVRVFLRPASPPKYIPHVYADTRRLLPANGKAQRPKSLVELPFSD